MKKLLFVLLIFPSLAFSQVIDIEKLLNSLDNFDLFKNELTKDLPIDTIFNEIQLQEGGIVYEAHIPIEKGISMILIAESEHRITIMFQEPLLEFYYNKLLSYLKENCMYNADNKVFMDWKCNDVFIGSSLNDNYASFYFAFPEK